MASKERVEIPPEIAAEVLFASDRTCCVCRVRRKPVQIHHVDDDPSNNEPGNLAVLCFDCHRDTQIRGGFDRKLDAAQIRLYRSDWAARVCAARDEERGQGEEGRPVASRARQEIVLRYVQVRDESEEHSYSLDADYPQLGPAGSGTDKQDNECIERVVGELTGRFRAEAIASAEAKAAMRASGFAGTAWDSLSISHRVWLLTPQLFSVELAVWRYGAGAAHPNHATRTLNLRRRPSAQLDLQDVFKPSSGYLKLLSDFCVRELHRQQPSRFHDPAERGAWLANHRDKWVLAGAGPAYANFKRFVLVKGGMQIFFDPYQVGSYAEGRYEVPVPLSAVEAALQPSVAALLR